MDRRKSARIVTTGFFLLAASGGCGHFARHRAVPPPPAEPGGARFSTEPNAPVGGFGGLAPGSGMTGNPADAYSPGGRYGTGAGGAEGGLPVADPPPALGGAGAQPVDPPSGE